MKKIFSTFLFVMASVALFATANVYYAGSYTDPHVHLWGGSTSTNWPGNAMTQTPYHYNGQIIWTYVVADNDVNIIFNNNPAPQTADLKIEKGRLYLGDWGVWVDYSGSGDVTNPEYQTPAVAYPATHGVSVPTQSEDVLLQAFYWDSDQANAKYGQTSWTNLTTQAEDIAKSFDLVWLMPCMAGYGVGYYPTSYSDFNSGKGSKAALRKLVNALHEHGAKVVADIVINHRSSTSGWAVFSADDFGSHGQFQLTQEHICGNDEAFTDSKSDVSDKSKKGANDTGENDGGCRDLDHTSAYVQNLCKAYLAYLQDSMSFDGWRYDMVKGYHGRYVDMYNQSSTPYFSVGEYWDGNVVALKNYLTNTNNHTMVFDFAAKYYAFNGGLDKGYYSHLRAASGNKLFRESSYSKYAVTFIDNHDTFNRQGGSEFIDQSSSKGGSLVGEANRNKVLEANAYLLSMPGIPAVFYPHWVEFHDEIAAMIAARKAVGIHSESVVVDNSYKEGSTNGKYEATIQGKRGTLILRLGNGRDKATPAGYEKACGGALYDIYITVGTAIENVSADSRSVEKRIENGQLVIVVDGVRYTNLGTRL